MRNANEETNLINEIKMRNATASANGMKIESFCAGDLSALACRLFISFSSSLLVSDLFKFLLAFTFIGSDISIKSINVEININDICNLISVSSEHFN